ncbi:MAG: hypothetical protein HKN85_10565, partial [Gammaproteobacteria bacterium]|nr:hypothetical protein [Gammaproteobacteria bacterium]
MKRIYNNSGFALFSVVWIAAILGLISLATLSSYLANTRSTQYELQRIKLGHLHDAGTRFAAISLAATRERVTATAVPADKLVYRSKVGNVLININNESAFIDLNTARPELIEALLNQLVAVNKLQDGQITLVANRLEYFANSGHSDSYRQLRESLSDLSGLFENIIGQVTLHNRRSGVHPALASPELLALLPDVSAADRLALVKNRN